MIAKNWPNDACVGCEGRNPSFLSEFIEVENILLEYNEKLIFDCGFLKKMNSSYVCISISNMNKF
jgi:hypothetical protein